MFAVLDDGVAYDAACGDVGVVEVVARVGDMSGVVVEVVGG